MRTIVLDDDPTGTQCASDVTVLLGGGEVELAAALADAGSIYYETNTRAMSAREAVELVRRVRRDGEAAGRRLGAPIRFVLRGDSTLRGHIFPETAEFVDRGGVILFVPAFPAGGRTTEGGVHYLTQAGIRRPVAATEFARDPVFGYGTSDLAAFCSARSGRPCLPVALEKVRAGALSGVLLGAADGAVVIPDVTSDEDITLIGQAVRSAEDVGRQVVARCAAPLAAELAGVRSPALLRAVPWHRTQRPLVVCGSHTDGATAQVDHLSSHFGPPTEILTANALEDPSGEAARAVAAERAAMDARGFAYLTTQRVRQSEHGSLADGARVMTALVAAAAGLVPHADALITKGGITASEIMRGAAGAHQARVLGQLEPGISAMLLATARHGELPCIVVPGNVGDRAVLLRALLGTGFAGQVATMS